MLNRTYDPQKIKDIENMDKIEFKKRNDPNGLTDNEKNLLRILKTENDPKTRDEMKLISDLLEKEGKDGKLSNQEKEILDQLFEKNFDTKYSD